MSVCKEWLLINFHPSRSTDSMVAATNPLAAFYLSLETAKELLTCLKVVSNISVGIHFSKQHLA